MTTQLHIPTPCAEKWSEMAPVRQDCRHCAVCEKNIVDFSMKTDVEILEYLRQNNGKVCGRFRNDQLGRPLLATLPLSSSRRKGLSWSIAASVAALLSIQKTAAQAPATPTATEQVPLPAQVVSDSVPPQPEEVRTISGKLLDEEGEPMIGASIRFAQKRGTVSDYDGIFYLRIPVSELTANPLEIQIRYLGYFDKTVELPQQVVKYDLALTPENTQMIPNHESLTTGILIYTVQRKTFKSRTRNFFRKLFH
jgi:hypothetical protein